MAFYGEAEDGTECSRGWGTEDEQEDEMMLLMEMMEMMTGS